MRWGACRARPRQGAAQRGVPHAALARGGAGRRCRRPSAAAGPCAHRAALAHCCSAYGSAQHSNEGELESPLSARALSSRPRSCCAPACRHPPAPGPSPPTGGLLDLLVLQPQGQRVLLRGGGGVHPGTGPFRRPFSPGRLAAPSLSCVVCPFSALLFPVLCLCSAVRQEHTFLVVPVGSAGAGFRRPPVPNVGGQSAFLAVLHRACM